MLIGIDASRATSAAPTGTEIYSRELIRALIAIDRANQYRLYLRENVSPDFFSQHESPITNYRLRRMPFPRFWTHLRLSYEMLTHAPELLWVPAHVLPPIHPRRSIVTIHDLGHLYFPSAHPAMQRFYHTWSTRWNARAASHLFADSEATRDDIIRFCGVASEKISVVYPAYDAQLYQPGRDNKTIEKIKTQYRVADDYILAIGTVHPRKNYARLIEAFGRLDAKRRDLRLVIVGKRGWLFNSIFSRVQALNLQAQISFLDYVPVSDMPALISGARLLAFPSLHEGFGLPVLEAQACGVPVVCAMTSSFPEAAGDGALFVDPFDVDAIASALQRALQDETLRAKLIENGLRNVKRFSWEQSARAVLEMFAV